RLALLLRNQQRLCQGYQPLHWLQYLPKQCSSLEGLCHQLQPKGKESHQRVSLKTNFRKGQVMIATGRDSSKGTDKSSPQDPFSDSEPSTLHALRQGAQLDVSSLERAVQGFFSLGLAQSSKSSYSTAQKRYLSFCASLQLCPLPLSERSLCLFAAYLANQGFQSRSIASYLSALRHLQIAAGLQAPPTDSWPWLHYVTRGIKRSQCLSNRTCFPITASIMRQLREYWPEAVPRQTSFFNKLCWAVACSAFCGFFRLGELLPQASGTTSPLLLTDIAMDSHSSPSFFTVHLTDSTKM
uniref:Core-binding (CB) domain-containing protein n=1 Tax=Amphimedon queenslandica TaxID=400682 RepID=A0A1X7VKM6_AMPQE